MLPEEVRRRVFVVVPAHNESASIERVAAELRAVYPAVVVVDDGSRDHTFEAATKSATYVLRHVVNRGQGAAIQTGIEFALLRGAQIIVTFDADGQHVVEDVAGLVAPIVAGECEVTLGSRFLAGAEGVPTARRRMLRLAVVFTRWTSRMSVTDAHNGLRAFSRRAAQRLQITLDRMAHASEILDQIHAAELPYREVPVRVRYTSYSTAKGQRNRGALRILLDYVVGRVFQ